MDAAIAAGAVLAVTMPWAGQLGGDCFLLVAEADGPVTAVNGSGAAPRAAAVDRYRGGFPAWGWLTSSVPGLVDGWSEAHRRFGALPWGSLFEPAATLAASGVVVTPSTFSRIEGSVPVWGQDPETARVFLPGGRPPPLGSVLVQEDLASTLQAVADDGPQVLYTGPLAERLVEACQAAGGLLSADDLASHTTPTPEPWSTSYRHATVFAQPPVSQAAVAPMTLDTLSHLPFGEEPPGSAPSVHLQVEATKAAFVDRLAYLGDPDHVPLVPNLLLSEEAARRRAASVDPDRAADLPSGLPSRPDTTSLVAADASGTVVTYLHSLYTGSGVTVPGTGVMLNSRMLGFSLDPASPNCLAPGKRPVHTLSGVMAVTDDALVGVCTPGANLQVQHQVQVLSYLLDRGYGLQESLDAPRWSLGDPSRIAAAPLRLEDRFGRDVLDGLAGRGHRGEAAPAWSVGAMQAVLADRTRGVLWAARDPRRSTSMAGAV